LVFFFFFFFDLNTLNFIFLLLKIGELNNLN